MSVDLEKRRISLSLKTARQGTAEPSPQVADHAKPSQGMGSAQVASGSLELGVLGMPAKRPGAALHDPSTDRQRGST